jgi:hypothetical protein
MASSSLRLVPMERATAASSGKGDGLLLCTLRHLCELASDLDSCGFRHRSKLSNHFSRPERSAMAREPCRDRISHRHDRNYRYVDTVLRGLRGTAAEVNDSWKAGSIRNSTFPDRRKDAHDEPADRTALEAQSSGSIARQQTLAGQFF